jgi:adenosine/AMP kinase
MDTTIEAVALEIPEGANLILGQSHFIKTVEDLAEVMATHAPAARYGLAFNEASGPCLVRTEGNDEGLVASAVKAARAVGAGHAFVLVLKNAFPISVLNQVKACQEVCRIFCATANPLQVLVARTAQGRGVVGVIDGASPQGVEAEKDRADRRAMLRKFGYKF